MLISIVGLGFVGGAMEKSFHQKNIKMNNYDKFKKIGNIKNILKSQICFLCLPSLFDEKVGRYDISSIDETLNFLYTNNYNGLVVLKSTIEPETTINYYNKYHLKLVHNPEFLSAKTAFDDFHNQTHIVIGKACENIDIHDLTNFYSLNYPEAIISLCSSTESESVKLYCNAFYATKIQFFNELYLLCDKNKSDYDTIKKIMLKNGWINQMHTTVPGSDGALSYGGACFPKDTKALNAYMERYASKHGVLESVIKERDDMRKLCMD